MQKMLIAQITDTHAVAPASRAYRDRIDTNSMLQAAVDRLNSLDPSPDLIVLTGDLTDHGTREEYAVLRDALDQLRAPLAVLVGNHDDRETFRRELADYSPLPQAGFLQYVVETRPVRFIALDSFAENSHEGAFCEKRARWLDECLSAAPDIPTIVGIHHPPFETGIVWMDGHGADWAAPLLGVLARHEQIVRVVCGHLHRPVFTEVAGRPVSICPGTAHQVPADLNPTQDFLAAPPAFEMEPAGFQLHVWDGGRLVTHTLHTKEWERIPLFTPEQLRKLMRSKDAGNATRSEKTEF